MQAARDALGLTFTYVAAFQVEAERLIQQTMTDAAFDALIDATFGKAEANATKRVRETERRRRSRNAATETSSSRLGDARRRPSRARARARFRTSGKT